MSLDKPIAIWPVSDGANTFVEDKDLPKALLPDGLYWTWMGDEKKGWIWKMIKIEKVKDIGRLCWFLYPDYDSFGFHLDEMIGREFHIMRRITMPDKHPNHKLIEKRKKR